MSQLNKTKLKQFLKIAGDSLDGDWIVIGGTVLPMLGVEIRSTVDIDFVSRNKKEQTLKLMEIADKLSLPIETINQAGAFFLYKIKDFEKNLIELHKGSSTTIYRPNLYLFLKLKCDRLSDSDVADCVEYIRYSQNKNEIQNAVEIKNYLSSRLKVEKNPLKLKKLKIIFEKLKTI